jgi:hypothetical protein
VGFRGILVIKNLDNLRNRIIKHQYGVDGDVHPEDPL